MSKLAVVLCLICLILTVLWLGLLIADIATAGPLETFEQVAAHASRLHGLFYATYLNGEGNLHSGFQRLCASQNTFK